MWLIVLISATLRYLHLDSTSCDWGTKPVTLFMQMCALLHALLCALLCPLSWKVALGNFQTWCKYCTSGDTHCTELLTKYLLCAFIHYCISACALYDWTVYVISTHIHTCSKCKLFLIHVYKIHYFLYFMEPHNTDFINSRSLYKTK